MATARVDLYTSVHKAIRQILFDLSSMEGRTDYGDRAGSATFADRATRALQLVSEHAEHEDREVLPGLKRHAPGVEARLSAQHVELESIAQEVLACAAALDTASDEERRSVGDALHVLVNRLVSGHLEHMAFEESDVNGALWAAFTDAELVAIQGRILSSIAPPRMAEWMQWMLPALNAAERSRFAASLPPRAS
jgi:hypothetical protein